MNLEQRPGGSRGGASGRAPAAARGRLFCAWTALGLVASAWCAGPAGAQDEVRNFEKPILVVETGGHRAPVRSLVWRDAFSLISGGQDKVVRVWDFRDSPRLVRSIRPMIFRGPAGFIYSMALSPAAGADGQSLLAVAGYGVEYRRGDFSVYRFPGNGLSPTGELAARVRAQVGNEIAHRDTVLTLAFDPAGKILATGGAGLDPTVILWDASRTVKAGDVETFRPLRRLVGHTGGIRKLAFLPPDGRRLATVGEDCTLRLWDVERGAALASFQARGVLNALAVSPDGRSLVAGSEAGELLEFNPADVRAPRATLPVRQGQVPIEFLAFSPDGRRLAASVKSDKTDTLDPMTIAFDLEVRDMPGGKVVLTRRVPGLLYAGAFSADGNRLAYSGGMNQAVSVQDLDDWAKPPVELKGQGSTVFDLGFRARDQVLGLTRAFDPANPPALYEGFDLPNRKSTTVPRNELARAVKEYQGWTLVGNINEYKLEAVNADGRRRWPVDLDAGRERLWWSWTFVPPGPGHPRATLAVGCEAGVVVYDLDTGRRTRFFTGHVGPVVSVVPSPDGHWLASGSIDQTVLLYPLAGCDTRPGFGATFGRRPDGAWVVASVERRGFAEAMGLVKGGVVTEAGYQSATNYVPLRPSRQLGADFWKELDELAPNSTIAIGVERNPAVARPGAVAPPQLLPSSKRDNPSLLLMLDVRREWVLWTPQGYYDTSIDGDTRLLGWHVNPAYDSTRPTDYLPIATFAPTLNRPGVIERLWATRSLDLAEADVPRGAPAPETQVAQETPPKVSFEPVDPKAARPDSRGVWQTTGPKLKLRVKISQAGGAKVGDRKIVFGEQLIKPTAKLGAGPVSEEDLDLELPPDRPLGLLVTASNDKGKERTETIEIEYHPPRPPPPPAATARPRLVVWAVGNSRFAGGTLPEIPAAEQDAESLAGFAAEHLVSGDGPPPDASHSPAPIVLTGPKATTGSARAGLDQLSGMLREKQLGKGDLVAVVVASHVLEFKPAELPAIAFSDTRLERPAETTLPARDLSELFGQLTDYGCRVVVFLDGVHEGWPAKSASARGDVRAWARDLQQKRRVITFVASNEGPSGTPAAANGLFALGVLNAFEGGIGTPAGADRDRPFTLEQFRAAVERDVLFRSNRQQQVGCYIPKGVRPWTPFARP